MAGQGEFFPMARGERLALAFLVCFAGLAFLPVWRHLQVLGMAASGWWMAALMLLSPILTL
jgi:hypothetical protein